jgi:predicted transcriptional regulator
MCAQVLSERGRSVRSIASELGVDESTVRYRLQRLQTKAADRRCGKPEACDSHASIIENWIEQQASPNRPEAFASPMISWSVIMDSRGVKSRFYDTSGGAPHRTSTDPSSPTCRDAARFTGPGRLGAEPAIDY